MRSKEGDGLPSKQTPVRIGNGRYGCNLEECAGKAAAEKGPPFAKFSTKIKGCRFLKDR